MNRAFLMVGILIILATGFVGFRFGDDKQSLVVKYEVQCKNCTVTYRDERGNSAEVLGVDESWEYEFVGKQGQFIYVSATNPDGTPTDVVIKRGGKELIKGNSTLRQQAARAGSIL